MPSTFVPQIVLSIIPFTQSSTASEKERKLRLETSMKLRVLYQEKQERWQAFRQAEQQRREDKARALEMDRLNAIIAESRARREYTQSKFQHSHTVRSYHQAALIIQRAYRRLLRARAVDDRLKERRERKRGRVRERAARVIQRNWRAYRQEKLFRAMNFVSVMTGPVVDVRQRGQSPPPPGRFRSYQKGISITGE